MKKEERRKRRRKGEPRLWPSAGITTDHCKQFWQAKARNKMNTEEKRRNKETVSYIYV